MKKFHVIAIFLMMVILASAWSPLPAAASAPQSQPLAVATSLLTINNRSGATITINLVGPRNYTILAVPGKMTQEIQGGKYRFAYKACGVNKTGTLSASSKSTKLNIPSCPMAKISLVNSTDGTLRLYLSGPNNYTFNIPAKTIQKLLVWKGSYSYTVYACGDQKSGKINLKGNNRWTWWCTR